MSRGLDAIKRLADDGFLTIVSVDRVPQRDLDYGDVTADADRMQAVLEMRALGHTDACIDSAYPGEEPTPGCDACYRI